jgi:hypothetical protein
MVASRNQVTVATHRLLMTTIPQFVAFMDKQFGPNPAKEQVLSLPETLRCRTLPFLRFAQDSLLAADARLYDSLRDKMHESGTHLPISPCGAESLCYV